MKNFLSVIFSIVLLVSVSLCASATNLSDGVYEVPITLMHKEDEKESFGNKYVAQTALLEVKSGKKTITIPLTTDMKGIEFSYYTNGSLSGDVAKGEPVSDVKVAGETYKQGFKIPVMADGDIGLQFSVPVMPMSPSARLRIDYGKSVLISASDTTKATQPQQITENTTEISSAQVSQPESTQTITQSSETQVTTEFLTQTESSSEETTAYANQTTTQEEDNGTPPYIFVVVFAVAVVVLGIAFVLIFKAKEKTKNDDK